MNYKSGKTALVSGASRGIGLEFAKILAENGFDLVLTARDEAALNRLAGELQDSFGIVSEIVISDLADARAAERIAGEISDRGISVDALINNAGFGIYGEFSRNDSAALSSMINCNMTAPTLLTRLLLPGMIERRGGMILNVASTASFRAGPLTAVYSATKSYLLSFSRALSSELKGTGVTVTALCPGPVDTDFQERAGMRRSGPAAGRKLMPAREIALFGYRSMMQGKTVAIKGIGNKAVVHASRMLPPDLLDRLSRKARE